MSDINVIDTLDRLINIYESIDKDLYKPLSSTIHNHVPFSAQLGITEISTVGLWFMSMFGTQPDSTIDAKTYIARAVDPTLGHELHTVLLLLNNEYDTAMRFDGRFDTNDRLHTTNKLPDRFQYSVYNSWNDLDRHIKEIITTREHLNKVLHAGA